MMKPVLEDLKESYTGKMEVQLIDIKKNPAAKQKYGIKIKPTQIFFDASGRELFRHEGFISKEDILTKWKELGVEFEKDPMDNDQEEKNKEGPEILPDKC
jgi:thioredoxin 1